LELTGRGPGVANPKLERLKRWMHRPELMTNDEIVNGPFHRVLFESNGGAKEDEHAKCGQRYKEGSAV
jgi:hypothetical protein